MPTSQLEDILYVITSTGENSHDRALILQICTSAGTAAQELGAESVEALLQHSVWMTSFVNLMTLVKCLPTAQTLSSTAAGGLLLSAVEAIRGGVGESMVSFLCRETPAAAAVDAGSCRKVLLRAMELRQEQSAEALVQLPAVKQLPATAVCELLAAAIQADFAYIAHTLCEMPGAEQLEHEALVELICAAEDTWTYWDISRQLSKQKPDRTLWSLPDLSSLAIEEYHHSQLGLGH